MSRPMRAAIQARGLLLVVGLVPGIGSLPSGSGAQTVERVSEPVTAGAVTTIYPSDDAAGARDVVDLLQWRVPGLRVEPRPDGKVEIKIREGRCAARAIDAAAGRETTPPNPLLVVDGFPVSNDEVTHELRGLNPARIERIDVLRDVAATSIYGTRGNCGVILIYSRRR